MRDLWLNLAALGLITAAGCFGSHDDPPDPDGGSDSGSDSDGPDTGRPPIDAGPGCDITTPFVDALTCPETVLEGTPALVTLTLTNGGCCGGGETFTDVQSAPDGSFVLESSMVVCDCCEACDCIGPTEITTIDLGTLSPGRHPVQAGERSCVIEVLAAGSCGPLEVSEVRMPRAIFIGQELPISLIARDVSGCDCTPRIVGSVGDPILSSRFAMEVCDCCEDCRCIDPGYEAAEVQPPPPFGEHRVPIGGLMPRVLSVRDRESCRPDATPTGLRIERPTDLVRSGPALTWAVITGEATVCCVEPMYVVESYGTRPPTPTLDLAVYDCTPEVGCACVGSPTSFEAWHSLGELSPGTYTVRANGAVQTFTID